MLQGLGEAVAGQARDAPAEDAVQGRPGALALVGPERVAGDTGAKDLRARVARIGGERVLRTAGTGAVERPAGIDVPATQRPVAAPRQQDMAARQEGCGPDRQGR